MIHQINSAEQLGKTLKIIRKHELGLKIQAASFDTGFCEATIMRIEKADRPPRLDTLLTICKAYGYQLELVKIEGIK